MSDESRVFWNKNAPDATPANERTVLVRPEESPPRSSPPLSIREQFSKNYGEIREWLAEQTRRRGVAIVAMGGDGVHAAAFLAAKPKMPNVAIIGRHSRADLHLGDDDSVSLRHVALFVFPAPSGEGSVRYRLVDLRTATAFLDERGKRLRALEAEGPAFVVVGRYTLLILPMSETEDPWPEGADNGWARIPDRLFLDEVEGEAKSREWEADSDRAWEVEDLPRLSEPPTLVHNVAGPEMAVHDLVGDGEPPLGEMLVTSSRGAATIVLGRRAVQSGILLGRSRRCDAGRVLSSRAISRVHLLVIETGGVLYAIDTASSNGVFFGEGRERVVRLEPGHSLDLSGAATLEWRRNGS